MTTEPHAAATAWDPSCTAGLQRVWWGGTAVAEPLCSHRAGCTHPALAQNHVRAEEMPVFCGLCISLALPKPVFGYKLI